MGISNLTGKRVKKGKSLLMKCDKPVLNRHYIIFKIILFVKFYSSLTMPSIKGETWLIL